MLKKSNIVLRKLEENDLETLTVLANNKKVAENLRDLFPFPYTIDSAKFFLNLISRENPQVTFAIDYENHFCGIIGLVAQTDVYRKSAEIGYWIGESFWGKGIASAAIELITNYGFNELTLERIYTGVFEYNVPSMKALEKNGFKQDGLFEKAIFKNGRLWNEHRYSKLKNSKS